MHEAVVTGTQGSVCCDMSDSNTCGAATSCVPSHSWGVQCVTCVCNLLLSTCRVKVTNTLMELRDQVSKQTSGRYFI